MNTAAVLTANDAANHYMLGIPRAVQDVCHKIRMHPSGRLVEPLNVQPEDIDIRDIAHHLSNECRYAGATPEHYSVAQHSVLVAEHLAQSMWRLTPEILLAALLHDAAEAYIKDLPSPMKHDPRFAFYREIDAALTDRIYTRFGVGDSPSYHAIKVADDAVFTREVQSFWGDRTGPGTIIPVSPWIAEQMFLTKFRQLAPREVW